MTLVDQAARLNIPLVTESRPDVLRLFKAGTKLVAPTTTPGWARGGPGWGHRHWFCQSGWEHKPAFSILFSLFHYNFL